MFCTVFSEACDSISVTNDEDGEESEDNCDADCGDDDRSSPKAPLIGESETRPRSSESVKTPLLGVTDTGCFPSEAFASTMALVLISMEYLPLRTPETNKVPPVNNDDNGNVVVAAAINDAIDDGDDDDAADDGVIIISIISYFILDGGRREMQLLSISKLPQ